MSRKRKIGRVLGIGWIGSGEDYSNNILVDYLSDDRLVDY